MRKTVNAALVAAAALLPSGEAPAQAPQRNTLFVMREIDADNYDPPHSTARAAGEALYTLSDTLVSLDWDQKTVLLAESGMRVCVAPMFRSARWYT